MTENQLIIELQRAYRCIQGMSLRDYFAAHAPAEPQTWFSPAMPLKPSSPPYLKDMTADERREYDGWRDAYLGAEDMTQPRVRAYVEATEAARKAQAAWNAENIKRTCVQWPYAWADAVLEARK